MPGSVSLTSNDTIKLFDRSLVDLADGECAKMTFESELAAVKTGKNGNSLYSFNETGKQATLELRLLRGSSDDKFLLNKLVAMKNNFSGFVLADGEFIKKVGDGQGNITQDIYIMSGGVFTKEVDVMSSAEGSIDQSVAVYTLKFTNAPRVIT